LLFFILRKAHRSGVKGKAQQYNCSEAGY